jgi:hypothetical protein
MEHLLFALPTLRLVDLEVSECGLNAFDVLFLHLGVVVEWRTSEALWAGLRGVATTGSQIIIELLLFVDIHSVALTSVLLRLPTVPEGVCGGCGTIRPAVPTDSRLVERIDCLATGLLSCEAAARGSPRQMSMINMPFLDQNGKCQ